MPRRGGAAAAEMLNDFISSTDSPRDAEEVLVAIIIDAKMAQDDDPAELAERWLSVFLRKAQELELSARMRRAPLNFEFNVANDEFIQGRHFVADSDSEDVKRSKLNRSQSNEIEAILHELTPNQFEQLCAIVLRKIGCREPAVSAQSNDQGIDFFGSIPFGEFIKVTALPDAVEESLRVWVFGQAKKYTKSIVKNAELREIVGSVELAKAKAYSSIDHSLSQVEVRACDPVFYMFLTSSRFTSGGHRLIENSGVIAMDGRQLSLFLADHQVGYRNRRFAKAAFLAEIDAVAFNGISTSDSD